MSKTSSNNIPESILKFWFGDAKRSNEASDQKIKLWWSKDKQVDQEITVRFAETCNSVATGGFDEWNQTARGFLASILCTDQFPRNMYRNTPQAFAYDPIALSFAKKCIAQNFDQQLSLIERTFAYMPFEHSEQLEDQERAVRLYQAIVDTAPSDEINLFKNYLNFAEQHLNIIQLFNRFPHRNRILGRESTKQELEFLKQKGSSF